MEDQQIIALYFARSEQAIAETAQKYGAYLAAVANNILHRPQDTEEILNDVYLAAWNRIPPARPRVLRHYLSRIARNLSFTRYDYLSADKRAACTEIALSELEECIPDSRRGPEEIVEAKLLGMQINRFLGSLSREDCALFVGRYFYLTPMEDLARKRSITPRQVKYRLEKLRKQLNAYLEKEGAKI